MATPNTYVLHLCNAKKLHENFSESTVRGLGKIETSTKNKHR